MSKLISQILPLVVFIFLSGCQTLPKTAETSTSAVAPSDALWNIINTKCVPNQKANQNPAPCEQVWLNGVNDQGFVVLKDRRGPLQYLLMPTTKIAGIESSEILAKDSPHYFYEAWKARSYMVKKYGSSIADQDISLAMNSALARSQNQLHIHISCIRPDVRMQINQYQGAVKMTWAKFPATLVGHTYFARRLSIADFKNKNVFKMISDDLPEAKENMQQYGVAIVPLVRKNKTRGFILLAEKADETSKNLASSEEIQDHDCPQLPLSAH